jgi:hypothetical protein
MASAERERMKLLERDNRERRRASEILKAAAATFFGFLSSTAGPRNGPHHRWPRGARLRRQRRFRQPGAPFRTRAGGPRAPPRAARGRPTHARGQRLVPAQSACPGTPASSGGHAPRRGPPSRGAAGRQRARAIRSGPRAARWRPGGAGRRGWRGSWGRPRRPQPRRPARRHPARGLSRGHHQPDPSPVDAAQPASSSSGPTRTARNASRVSASMPRREPRGAMTVAPAVRANRSSSTTIEPRPSRM